MLLDLILQQDEDETDSSIGHMFQFQVWKKSLDVKYTVNSAVILIIALGMLSLANELTNSSKDIKSQMDVINGLIAIQGTSDVSSQLAGEYAKMQHLSNEYILYLNSLIALCTLTYSYSV